MEGQAGEALGLVDGGDDLVPFQAVGDALRNDAVEQASRLTAATVAVAGDPKSAVSLKQLTDNPGRIDFRRFSRAENRALKAYDFSYDAVLKAAR